MKKECEFWVSEVCLCFVWLQRPYNLSKLCERIVDMLSLFQSLVGNSTLFDSLTSSQINKNQMTLFLFLFNIWCLQNFRSDFNNKDEMRSWRISIWKCKSSWSVGDSFGKLIFKLLNWINFCKDRFCILYSWFGL